MALPAGRQGTFVGAHQIAPNSLTHLYSREAHLYTRSPLYMKIYSVWTIIFQPCCNNINHFISDSVILSQKKKLSFRRGTDKSIRSPGVDKIRDFSTFPEKDPVIFFIPRLASFSLFFVFPMCSAVGSFSGIVPPSSRIV